MKSRSRMFAFAVASLLATAALGQEAAPPAAPMAPVEQAQPMAQQDSMPAASGSLTDVHSVQIGPSITVNSGMPPGGNYGPKPPFAQLAQGRKCISHEAAKAYLPLYNDWLHAAGHGSCISRSQYEAWH